MNKKGFTLIELLGVIIILSVVAVIAVPLVGKYIAETKEATYEKQIATIKIGAQNYVTDNKQTIDFEKTGKITLAELKNKGYINGELVDPRTKQAMNGCVIVTKQNKNFRFEYQETCS